MRVCSNKAVIQELEISEFDRIQILHARVWQLGGVHHTGHLGSWTVGSIIREPNSMRTDYLLGSL